MQKKFVHCYNYPSFVSNGEPVTKASLLTERGAFSNKQSLRNLNSFILSK